MTLIDLEDLYAPWQWMLPLTNETCPHVFREQLLSKHPWIRGKVVKQEAKNSVDSYVVDFSGVDPSPGRAPFENELRRYSAQRCTTVPEIASCLGPGTIVDCRDPYLQEWILKLNNTPHTRGYTMKVEQRRPCLKPKDIYALAHKRVSEMEVLERLNKGQSAQQQSPEGVVGQGRETKRGAWTNLAGASRAQEALTFIQESDAPPPATLEETAAALVLTLHSLTRGHIIVLHDKTGPLTHAPRRADRQLLHG